MGVADDHGLNAKSKEDAANLQLKTSLLPRNLNMPGNWYFRGASIFARFAFRRNGY
jgi:hypothetical protein